VILGGRNPAGKAVLFKKESNGGHGYDKKEGV
jgi:hypothetical protein